MRRTTIAIAVGWAVFVVATNAWLGFGTDARLVSDIAEYEQIALAAPGFPAVEIRAQHAQRWPVHWTVGAIGDVSRIPVATLYWIAAFAAFAALIAVSAAAARHVTADPRIFAIAIGLVAASVFPGRFGLAVPGMVTDAVFATGVGMCTLGAIRQRHSGILAGLLVASLARPQSAVPLGVVAAMIAWPVRRSHALCFAALPVIAFVVLDRAATGFAARAGVGLRDATLLGDSTVASAVADVATQAMYVAAGLALPICALLAAALGVRRWPREAIVAAAFAAAVALQPLVLSPDWTGRASLRLGALAVVPVAVAAAVLLGERARSPALPAVMVAIAAISLGSLRHAYTWLPGSEWTDLALTGVAGTLLLAACLTIGRASRAPGRPALQRSRDGEPP